MRGPKGASPSTNISTQENCEDCGHQSPEEGFQKSSRCNESCQAQQRVEVKETLDGTDIVLSRVMSFHQQANKQAEEKGLAENPESLKQSMAIRALFNQNIIPPENNPSSTQASDNG